MTADTNFHADYVSPGSFTKPIIELLSFMVESNEAVTIPDALLDVYGEFATDWSYDWATVKEYVDRLEEWIVCGPESFLGAICLMKRLEKLGSIPPITQKTVHRVYLTCLVLAVKVFEDETLNNNDFAKVGCVSVQELNRMEAQVCNTLKFNLTISEQEYEDAMMDIRSFDATSKRKRSTKTLVPRDSPADPVGMESVFEEIRELHGKRKPSFSKRTTEFFGSVRKSANLGRRLSATLNPADLIASPRSHKSSDKISPVFIIRQDSC